MGARRGQATRPQRRTWKGASGESAELLSLWVKATHLWRTWAATGQRPLFRWTSWAPSGVQAKPGPTGHLGVHLSPRMTMITCWRNGCCFTATFQIHTKSPWAHSDPEPHSEEDSGNMAPALARLTLCYPMKPPCPVNATTSPTTSLTKGLTTLRAPWSSPDHTLTSKHLLLLLLAGFQSLWAQDPP